MSTYYREVKKPARYVRLEQGGRFTGPAHARITVWDNAGAHVGSLTVKAEEAQDWLQLFAGGDVAQIVGRELKLFKAREEIGDRSLISEYGEVVKLRDIEREFTNGG